MAKSGCWRPYPLKRANGRRFRNQTGLSQDDELSAEGRRPAPAENQVRAMIGGGVEKRCGLSTPSEIHGELRVLYLNDARELLLALVSMSVVPQGAV